jgi:hypothetical protein
MAVTFLFIINIKKINMSEGSKFNFKNLIWVAVALLFLAGVYYVLNVSEMPEIGELNGSREMIFPTTM